MDNNILVDLIIYQTSTLSSPIQSSYFHSYQSVSCDKILRQKLSNITRPTVVINNEYLTYVSTAHLVQYLKEIIALPLTYPMVLLTPYQLSCPRLIKSKEISIGTLYTVNNFSLCDIKFRAELYFPTIIPLLKQNNKKIIVGTLLPAILYHNMNNINTLQDYHNNDPCQNCNITTTIKEDRPYLLVIILLLLFLIILIWIYLTWLS